jgi:hypothetical protein
VPGAKRKRYAIEIQGESSVAAETGAKGRAIPRI